MPANAEQPTAAPNEKPIADTSFSVKVNFGKLGWIDSLCFYTAAMMAVVFLSDLGLRLLALRYDMPQLKALSDGLLDVGMLDARLWQGEVWRPLTAIFLHQHLLHVTINILIFAALSRILRFIYAGRSWFWIFLISAYFGGVLTVLVGSHEFIIGASTGIMGMLGAMLVGRLRQTASAIPSHQLPAHRFPIHKIILVLAMQLGMDQMIPHVAYMAHICGFVVGFAVAFLLPLRAVPKLIVSRAGSVKVLDAVWSESSVQIPSWSSITVEVTSNFRRKEDFLAVWSDSYGGLFGPVYSCFPLLRGAGKITPDTDFVVLAGQYEIPGMVPPAPVENESPEAARPSKLWTVAEYGVMAAFCAVFYNLFTPDLLLEPAKVLWLKEILPQAMAPSGLWLGTHLGAIFLSYFFAQGLSHLLVSVLAKRFGPARG
jgi:rhomboid protease GluP